MKTAKIVNIETFLVDIPIKTKTEYGEGGVFPFDVSYGTLTGLKRVFFKIEAETENKQLIAGWGESSPLYPYSNESPLSVFELLQNYYAPALQGVKINCSSPESAKNNIDGIIDAIAPFCSQKRLNFTQTAIDYALHDLAGKLTNTPVYKLLNSDTTNENEIKGMPCWSISSNEDIETALPFVKKGYALKLKLSHDLESNIRNTITLIKRYHSEQHPPIQIRVDANAAMSLEEFSEYELKVSRQFPDEVFEQIGFYIEEPIDVKIYGCETFAELIKRSRWGIMADESLYTIEDAQKLIDLTEGQNLLFNIKVQKVGGLKNALQVAEIAKKNNVPIMIGGMFPSSLGKLANCHYALAIGEFLESDGLHPSGDYIPEQGSTIENIAQLEVVNNGRRELIVFKDKPGFGAVVSEKIISEHRIDINLGNYYPDFAGFQIKALEAYKK